MNRDEHSPCIAQRYASAIKSSRLQVLTNRCDADFLVAAGWLNDSLGASLFRLRSEWDSARAELRLANDNAIVGAHHVENLRRLAAQTENKAETEADYTKAGNMRADAWVTRSNAKKRADDVEATALSDRALAMVHMKSMRLTANAVYVFAVGLGVRVRFTNAKALREIAPRALQLWLDPNCPHCNGIGHLGGALEALRWCLVCDKTGKRIYGKKPFRMHRSDTGHEFGRTLLTAMDGKCERAAQAMKLYLHSQRGPDEKLSASQIAALTQHLAELRSPQAQED